MTYKMDKDPNGLPKDKLIALAENLMAYMYLESPAGQESFWNPDKEISGADLVELVDELLAFYKLRPIPSNPKDWSPRKAKRRWYL